MFEETVEEIIEPEIIEHEFYPEIEPILEVKQTEKEDDILQKVKKI